jgi:hypothetical protein
MRARARGEGAAAVMGRAAQGARGRAARAQPPRRPRKPARAPAPRSYAFLRTQGRQPRPIHTPRVVSRGPSPRQIGCFSRGLAGPRQRREMAQEEEKQDFRLELAQKVRSPGA